MATITTNDGATVYYEEHGSGKPLIMIHGWGCTPAFFTRNAEALGGDLRVINMALRGHGKSEAVRYGHRISRYAADLRDLIVALELEDVTVLGWSMGASVIWSHYDLFRDTYISQMVIVDQSPRQYAVAGGQSWQGIQVGCYDAESLAVLNTSLSLNSRAVAEGLVGACFPAGVDPTPEEVDFFASEIETTPNWVRMEIMTDHTNLDWRDLLPTIQIPALVMIGAKSQIWGPGGAAYPGEQIPNAQVITFDESGHMPFYHEAAGFNEAVKTFVVG